MNYQIFFMLGIMAKVQASQWWACRPWSHPNRGCKFYNMPDLKSLVANHQFDYVNNHQISLDRKGRHQQIQMKQENIKMRISYLHISRTKDIKKHHMEFSLDSIFCEANDFIKWMKQTKGVCISNFLNVEMETQEGFRNVYEILDGEDYIEFSLIEEKQFPIDIRLTEHISNHDDRLMREWNDKVEYVFTEKQNIKRGIKEHEKNLEKANKELIDLAFFYASPIVQPIVSLNPGKQVVAARREVSYHEESVRFLQSIKKNGAARDAFITIQIATKLNISRALSQGVKILHFSCHGKDNSLFRKDNELLIESSHDIGMSEFMNVDTLIRLLQNNTPEMIVFSACYSKSIAQKIQKHFKEKHGKEITTMGHEQTVHNSLCEILAEVFYPKIFKGAKIEDAFAQVEDRIKNELRKEHVTKVHIFPKNSNQTIHHSQIGANIEATLDIFNRIEDRLEKAYCIRLELYNFMREYLIPLKKAMIVFQGEERMGKTLFVKNSVDYLKQRKQISRCLYLNLRCQKNEINNIAWFRIEVECKIKEFLSEECDHKTLLVLDHCDSILQNQPNQFVAKIKEINEKIQAGKIMLIMRRQTGEKFIEKFHSMISATKKYDKKNFKFEAKKYKQFQQFIVFEEPEQETLAAEIEGIDKINALPEHHLRAIRLPKLNSLSEYQQKIAKIKQDEETKAKAEYKEFCEYEDRHFPSYLRRASKSVDNFLKEQNENYILEFPIINLLTAVSPSAILVKANSAGYLFEEDLQKFMRALQIKASELSEMQKVAELAKSIQILASYQYIEIRNTKDTILKKNFILLMHRCIGLCYVGRRSVKKSQQVSLIRQRMNSILFLLEVKLLLFLYCLTVNPESIFYSERHWRIYKDILDHRQQNSLVPLKSLLWIYETIQSMSPLHFENTIVSSIEVRRRYWSQIAKLEEALDQFQKWGMNGDSYLFGQLELKIMKMPALKYVSNYLDLITDSELFKGLATLQTIESELQSLNFLEGQDNRPARLFQKFEKLYMEATFSFQKIWLSKINHKDPVCRKDIAKKFDKWIKICENKGYNKLKDEIFTFKNQSFNSCVALTSMPLLFIEEALKRDGKDSRIVFNDRKALINPLRCEMAIHRLIVNTFEKKVKKTIFPRMDNFSQEVLKKYRDEKLRILIALFWVDCNEIKPGELFLEDREGRLRRVYISDLTFFKSKISIFIGIGAKNIKTYFDNNPKSNLSTTSIYIDLSLQENPENKYLDQKDHNSIYHHTKMKLIGLEIIEGFYESFCHVMFNEEHEYFKFQVEKAYAVAKESGRLKANLSYGLNFNEEINQIIDGIESIGIEDQMMERERLQEGISKLAYPLKINQIIQNLIFSEETQNSLQLGFNSSLHRVLKSISAHQQAKTNQTLYFIIHLPTAKMFQLDEKKKKMSKKPCMDNKYGKMEQRNKMTMISEIIEFEQVDSQMEDDEPIQKSSPLIPEPYLPPRELDGERHVVNFIECLKVKLRKMAAFSDFKDGETVLKPTANSSIRQVSKSSLKRQRQAVKDGKALDDDHLIIHQDVSTDFIHSTIVLEAEMHKKQNIRNRAVLFTTTQDVNPESAKFIHVENSIFNITADISFRAMKLSMRQLLLPEPEVRNGLERLMDEFKGIENKKDKEKYDKKKDSKKDPKRDKKPDKKKNDLNMKNKVQEFLRKIAKGSHW